MFKLNNLIKHIIKINNNDIHREINILGIKIKIKSYSLLSEKRLLKKYEIIEDFIVKELIRNDDISEQDKFSVIIPTLQKAPDILNLLVQSLLNDSTVKEIIIIDNSLKGGIKHNSDKVKIIVPEKNLYVNPSWNLGIEKINSKYFAILNDDLLLPPKMFIQVAKFLKNNKSCGLIGLESKTVIDVNKKDFTQYPKAKILAFKPMSTIKETKNWFWGSAIFGEINNYHKIPDNMLIYSGDAFLLLKNMLNGKQNYAIYNINIKHCGHLSSGSKDFENIRNNDKKIYQEIKNKLLMNH